MKTIEFSDEETNALVQLLDIAVKAGGLNVAQAASSLAAKISRQITAPSETTTVSHFAEPSIEPASSEEE
jgi:predicted DNA-binding transcriptional regulator YafY